MKLLTEEPFLSQSLCEGRLSFLCLASQGHSRVICGGLPSLHGHPLALTFTAVKAWPLGPSSVRKKKNLLSIPPKLLKNDGERQNNSFLEYSLGLE